MGAWLFQAGVQGNVLYCVSCPESFKNKGESRYGEGFEIFKGSRLE